MQIIKEPSASQDAAAVLRAMFAARKQVFVDQLKWDIPVLAGKYEIDQFDTPDAIYLILAEADGCHRASARILPTDRPHILADLFPLLSTQPVPSGPTVREITRFCIDPSLPRGDRREARNQLVTALVDYALAAGVSTYTAVATEAWFRQICRFGWRCQALGPVRNLCGEALVGLRIEIDRETPAQLKDTQIYVSGAFTVESFAGAIQ